LASGTEVWILWFQTSNQRNKLLNEIIIGFLFVEVRDKVTSEGQELLNDSEKEEIFVKVMKELTTVRDKIYTEFFML
jgi:hypothetical protein